jgi:hypothetical protein
MDEVEPLMIGYDQALQQAADHSHGTKEAVQPSPGHHASAL